MTSKRAIESAYSEVGRESRVIPKLPTPRRESRPPSLLNHRQRIAGIHRRAFRGQDLQRTGSLSQSSHLSLVDRAARTSLGTYPRRKILKDPKSLYQRPSGASGSLSRHCLSSYRSSVVIFRSRARSKRCSRSSVGKSDHWILGTYFPNVIRANSFLIAVSSPSSSVARKRSAS